MARKYIKRYYRRRAKWSANIQELGTTNIVIEDAFQGAWFRDFVLTSNPIQQTTQVSQTYTVKNVEVTFSIEPASNAGTINILEDIVAYIMYVPQGMQVTSNYNLEHPEYIMAYKFLGSPTSDNPTSLAQPPRIKTRLSRILQSGDSIVLFLKGNKTSTSQFASMDFHGLCRWWTKAN